MTDPFAFAPLLVVVALAAGVLGWVWHHRRALRAGLSRLTVRDGLEATATPCGLGAVDLADLSGATPRGARRYGVEHGVVGPVRTTLTGDDDVEIQLSAFQWWYEERVRDQQRSHYRRRTCTVALARLPVRVPGTVRIRPEGVLGRLGLRRAGDQLESDQFNRRFHVEGSDAALTVRLLDARLQHHLLTACGGRTLDVAGELLVLGGSPAHRDPTLPGVVAELPAVREDLATLVRNCPPAFWRAARPTVDDSGADRSGDGR